MVLQVVDIIRMTDKWAFAFQLLAYLSIVVLYFGSRIIWKWK